MLPSASHVHDAGLPLLSDESDRLAGTGLSNRMANLTSMRPNDEFYLMGRVPKAKA